MSSVHRQELPPGVIITHPNRGKSEVKATRATVILLLLVTVGLVLAITIGGWSTLEGPMPIQIGYILVYIVLAFFAVRWNRGVLPMASALGVILAIFALVAAPGWFERNKPHYAEPALNAGLLGVLTLLVIPVQLLLIAFAMRGFSQGWNVELEQLDPNAIPAIDDGPHGPPSSTD